MESSDTFPAPVLGAGAAAPRPLLPPPRVGAAWVWVSRGCECHVGAAWVWVLRGHRVGALWVWVPRGRPWVLRGRPWVPRAGAWSARAPPPRAPEPAAGAFPGFPAAAPGAPRVRRETPCESRGRRGTSVGDTVASGWAALGDAAPSPPPWVPGSDCG